MVTVFASLTLKWPWHDLQIAFGWYSSKTQHHPMSNFINPIIYKYLATGAQTNL